MTITIEHDYRKQYPLLNGRSTEHETLKDILVAARSNDHSLQGGVRLIMKSQKLKDTYGCVFEEPPRLRRITFRHKYVMDGEEHTTEKTYEVWTPWMVYFITAGPQLASIVYMYFTKGPIRSDEDRLYFPTIPNIYLQEYMAGKVCNGALSSPTEYVEGGINWQSTIAGVLSDFWTSKFNEDIMAFENLHPFSIVAGMEYDPANDDPSMPTIHQGMSNWEKIGPDDLMVLPFHHLFRFGHLRDHFVTEHGYREETFDHAQTVSYWDMFRRRYKKMTGHG